MISIGAGDAASGSRICGRRRDVAAQEAFVMREKKKLLAVQGIKMQGIKG